MPFPRLPPTPLTRQLPRVPSAGFRGAPGSFIGRPLESLGLSGTTNCWDGLVVGLVMTGGTGGTDLV